MIDPTRTTNNNPGMNRRDLFVTFLARALAALAIFAGLSFAALAQSANLNGVGVVYLHGKGAWPGAADGGILSTLAERGGAGGDAGNAVVVQAQIRRHL